MSEPPSLPPHLRRHAFDRATAASAGVPAARLRRGDLVRPFHGVLVSTAPTSLLARCRSYSIRMREGQAFSHVTAAQLHGVPLPRHLESDEATLHVSAVMPASAPRGRGVTGHRLRVEPPTMTVLGLPAVTPPEAWAQLAGVLSVDELIEAADFVLNLLPEVPGLARRLLETAAALPGRPGAIRLRAAVREARAGCMSPGETRVRLLLVRAGIPEPKLNTPTYDARGHYLGKPDLRWPTRMVGVEYEGAHHFRDSDQYRYDVRRYQAMADAGWTVVRVVDDDLRGSGAIELVARMRRLLA